MKKLIFCILIFATLTACSNDNAADKPMPSKFKPVVNPHPKYFMTVKGYIAPNLLNKVKLVWGTTYVTSNPKCQLTINDFEGVHAPRQVTDKLIVQPNSKGIYENKIALDKYQKGFCGWTLSNMQFDLGDVKNNVIAIFSDPKKIESKVAVIEAKCNKNSSCKITNYFKAFNRYLRLNIQHGLVAVVNVTNFKKDDNNGNN